MARVKRGTTKNKRRKNLLAQAKGYRFDRKSKERIAHVAVRHAGIHAFKHRRAKKRDARALFTLRINAAVRPLGFSYSRFIDKLKKAHSSLDRKALSTLAKDHPETFERLVRSLS